MKQLLHVSTHSIHVVSPWRTRSRTRLNQFYYIITFLINFMKKYEDTTLLNSRHCQYASVRTHKARALVIVCMRIKIMIPRHPCGSLLLYRGLPASHTAFKASFKLLLLPHPLKCSQTDKELPCEPPQKFSSYASAFPQ